jgi:hypothetical protein
MPYALLTPDGQIKLVVPKPSPFMQIGPGERLVRYDPPTVDTEMADAVPTLPVPPAQAAVQFVVTNKPNDIAWSVVRRKRNALLRDCDWTQLADSPVDPTARQQWVMYRQSLRNITQQPDPHNLTWPTPPSYAE